MAPLNQHHSASVTKLLLIGDSGSGKTGALASLAKAGFELRIVDFDNGTDILRNTLLPSEQLRVDVETCTDSFRIGENNAFIPKSASAWPKAVKLLKSWPGLGSLESWDENIILVIDSLTFAGRAALRFIQQLNGRLGQPPNWDDYREAQRLVEGLAGILYSDSIKCNVICISHIREIGRREDILLSDNKIRSYTVQGSEKGFPETGTGQALSPTIGRFFNSVLLCDIVGTGASAKRVIRTVPHLNIGLKNSAPGKAKPFYELEGGLAAFFKDVRSPVPATDLAKPVKLA